MVLRVKNRSIIQSQEMMNGPCHNISPTVPGVALGTCTVNEFSSI